MDTDRERPPVGFIGLGDQGLPMATAIAEAGFPLHAWARRSASLDGLRGVPHARHDDIRGLAAACDIVALCVSTDEDVLQLVTGGLLEALRPGAVVVNHGTGLPSNAVRLTEICAPAGVEVLDAPVSGGRPAAEERRLTTLVGGPRTAVERCEPVFASFSRHVVHLGGAGAGQTAKLFNNALLAMNQAGIAEIVDLAAAQGMDPARLVGALKLGSASSAALTLLNTMVTLDNVEHLSRVEALDMELFDTAMREAGVDPGAVTQRGMAGARGLSRLLHSLNSKGPAAAAGHGKER
ncbi:6-phosphogluconate dehydrogenase [Actinomadura sp. NBRC 104425]|uniref:NAD(P)-dependent oxidoreductase n=1 Tax=Actinomadura sp. NBRC 104425 TaxID=3032204 RepID=UPI0024A5C5F8|nr:NAD(P)-dependent oxidoreductase [Actinomadura sp. NBRC 104425]GLZ11727.1 6-phosphogluconate dehydrogenase [Actinomadura sp. NBRC 104425]